MTYSRRFPLYDLDRIEFGRDVTQDLYAENVADFPEDREHRVKVLAQRIGAAEARAELRRSRLRKR